MPCNLLQNMYYGHQCSPFMNYGNNRIEEKKKLCICFGMTLLLLSFIFIVIIIITENLSLLCVSNVLCYMCHHSRHSFSGRNEEATHNC